MRHVNARLCMLFFFFFFFCFFPLYPSALHGGKTGLICVVFFFTTASHEMNKSNARGQSLFSLVPFKPHRFNPADFVFGVNGTKAACT